MENHILEAINRFSLIEEKGVNVTVALSGGADSMALLYGLLKLSEKLGITVDAAHLNHMIRGEEAERDTRFVKEQCEKLGVKLFCEYADIPAIAEKNGVSLELAARNARYEFLRRVSSGLVATAHTASDNLETLLFNLTRGSGLDGLCGIPPKRDIFIRPLITCTRDMVENYCSENNIPFVTDSTNLTDDYTRNKLRHKVVPVLKEINPAAEINALRMSSLLRQDAEVLKQQALDYISANLSDGALSIKGILTLDEATATRIIKLFIEMSGCKPQAVHIKSVLKTLNRGGKTDLPEQYIAVAEQGRLCISKRDEKTQNREYFVNITYSEEKFSENAKKINNLFLNNSLDCDRIVGQLCVRTRLSGDSIRLLNRGCTKSLTKLYSECRIPSSERDRLPVIADDEGVIWIYGIGVAQRCAVTVSTSRVAHIEAGLKEY